MSRSQQSGDKSRAASDLFSDLYPGLAGWIRRLVDDVAQRHGLAADERDALFAEMSDYMAAERSATT